VLKAVARDVDHYREIMDDIGPARLGLDSSKRLPRERRGYARLRPMFLLFPVWAALLKHLEKQ
jgi:hypothetical protein